MSKITVQSPIDCPQCNGSGQQSLNQYDIDLVVACTKCGGTGTIIITKSE